LGVALAAGDALEKVSQAVFLINSQNQMIANATAEQSLVAQQVSELQLLVAFRSVKHRWPSSEKACSDDDAGITRQKSRRIQLLNMLAFALPSESPDSLASFTHIAIAINRLPRHLWLCEDGYVPITI